MGYHHNPAPLRADLHIDSINVTLNWGAVASREYRIDKVLSLKIYVPGA